MSEAISGAMSEWSRTTLRSSGLLADRRSNLWRLSTKFSNFPWQFEDIAQKHFGKESKRLGVSFREFVRVMQSCIAFDSHVICPSSNIGCNSVIFVQPFEALEKCGIGWNAVHR